MNSAPAKTRRILELFYEPQLSGISRHVMDLLEGIDRDRYQFWILCSTADDRIGTTFKEIVGRDRVKIVPPGRYFSFRGFLEAFRLIRRHEIDTVHIHNLQSALWGYGAEVLSRCERIIFTPQVSRIGIPHTEWLFRQCWKLLTPFTYRYIAVSKPQRENIIGWGIAEPSRVALIRNRIDQNKMFHGIKADRDAVREANGLPEDAVVICQVGRLDRQKNPFFLLRVAELTVSEAPNTLFLLVGEGRLRESLESAINARELTERVRLLGFRRDVPELLMAADILTLTSRWEGLPYVMMEAYLMRKPIVCTSQRGELGSCDQWSNWLHCQHGTRICRPLG